ncbi:MAG: hypothetical protein IKT12_07460 [Thermoguttaceae bacterium]|nr:hypothetical protein [Thermoguttaceae bacterium]
MKVILSGLLGIAIVLAAAAGLSAQSFSDYQVSGSVASSYECPEPFYGGYVGGGVYAPAVPIFGRYTLYDRSSMYRTYPGGLAPYARYGAIFGFVRPGYRGGENPYQGIDPEANNPYAGHTVTRGPRDFLMKNPPNIGP